MWVVRLLMIAQALVAYHFIFTPFLDGVDTKDAFVAGFLFCALLELIDKIAKVIWECAR